MVHAVKPVMRLVSKGKKSARNYASAKQVNTQVTTEGELRLSEKLRLHVTFAVKVRKTMTHGTPTTSSPLTLPHLLRLPTNPATSPEATSHSNRQNKNDSVKIFLGKLKNAQKWALRR